MSKIELKETLIIEMTLNHNVGTGPESVAYIKKYFREVAELLGAKIVEDHTKAHENPSVHLSKTYGQSGWVAFTRKSQGGAAHFYAWERGANDLENPHLPFVTIDITADNIKKRAIQKALIEHAAKFFDGKEVVHKLSSNPKVKTWKKLAPSIIRQRLQIVGGISKIITPEDAAAYFKEIASELEMVALTIPIVLRHKKNGLWHAWGHWETSGWHLTCSPKQIGIQIYTCKSFAPGKALNHVLNSFPQIDHFSARAF